MAIIKKTDNNQYSEDVKKLKPSYTVVKNVKWYTHFGKQYGNSLNG
jgi:hypothetical protein